MGGGQLWRYSRGRVRASALKAHALDVVLLLAVQLSLFIPGVGGAVALGLLCLFSLTGVDQAIKALLVSVLVTFANPGVFPKQDLIAEFKWLLLLFGLWAAIKEGRNSFRYPGGITLGVALFLASSIWVSTLFGLSPSLSMLKLASFTLGLVTTFRLAALSRTQLEEWMNFFLVVLLWIAVVSLPLLGSSAGRFLNGVGFQGVISHPQSFGTLMAALPVIGFLRSLTSSKRMTYLWLSVSILGAYLLFESQARTAMLAAFISVSLSLWVYMSKKNRKTSRLAARLIMVCFALMLILLGSGGSDSPLVLRLVSAVQKRTSHELDWRQDTLDALMSSRADQITEQSDTVKERPFTGTGFGIQNVGQANSSPEDSFMGIPLSSPNEPGFLPLAVVAQTGVVGAMFFGFALWRMFRAVLKGRQLEAVGLFTVLLAVNLGEAIAFSFGGLGLFMWIGVAFAVRYSAAESQARKTAGWQQDRALALPIGALEAANPRQGRA
jgi:hypothetical protein